MTKREIVNKIARSSGLPQQSVKRIIEELLRELREALVRGERIEIRILGFSEERERDQK